MILKLELTSLHIPSVVEHGCEHVLGTLPMFVLTDHATEYRRLESPSGDRYGLQSVSLEKQPVALVGQRKVTLRTRLLHRICNSQTLSLL